MGKIFLTSDLHFNHANILKYEPESRPFESISEMNETLISNWNSVISNDDDVWVCGDFFMGSILEIGFILSRLNGKIHLVRGNHDTENRLRLYRDEFGIDVHDIAYIPYKGRFFILCHFPIASEEFIKMVRNDNSEVVICYGHIHHNAPSGYSNGTFHVGVDTNNLTPVCLDDIWNQAWPKEEEMSPEVKRYKEVHDTAYIVGKMKDNVKPNTLSKEQLNEIHESIEKYKPNNKNCNECLDYMVSCSGFEDCKPAAAPPVEENRKTCSGCVWTSICPLGVKNKRCQEFQKDSKDGGFYG